MTNAASVLLSSSDQSARLAGWLSQALGDAVSITAAAAPGAGGGWSNETIIVDLAGASTHRVVVRLRPEGPAMFRDYDLTREYRVLSALSSSALSVGPPVPKVLAIDETGTVLGRPAFAMQYIDGRVPRDDKPTFAEAGWLHAASPFDQNRFCMKLIECIGQVHAVNWRTLGLGFLARGGHSALAGEIDRLRDLDNWGAGNERQLVIGRGFTALTDTQPAPSEPCLLWGDARPANVIARDFEPVALIDWELAHLGPPEMDIAWYLEMNHMRTIGAGVPPLPGFLDDDGIVVAYRQATGRELHGLAWYRLFSVVKMAVLMERHLRVAIARGTLPAGHRLLTDNVALRRLARLLPDGRRST
jgi:aminoglycoside phosphotransferase (APT) family kinase protein